MVSLDCSLDCLIIMVARLLDTYCIRMPVPVKDLMDCYCFCERLFALFYDCLRLECELSC